jgi:hypothetical protein
VTPGAAGSTCGEAASPDLALRGLLERVRLPGRAAILKVSNRAPRLPAERARADRRAEARVRTNAVPRIHEDIYIALDQAGVDPVDVACLDCPAPIYDIRERCQEAIHIAFARIDLRLVTSATREEARAYRQCETRRRGALAARRSTTCERRGAVQDVAAHFRHFSWAAW